MPVSSLLALVANELLPKSSHPAIQESSNIIHAPKIPRHEIGLAKDHLQQELLQMYWEGAKRELAHVVLSLKRWQEPGLQDIVLDDEMDGFIHGYDTFIDAVSHNSRKFAHLYGQRLDAAKVDGPPKPPTYEQALKDRGWNVFTEEKSAAAKEEIRAMLEQRDATPLLRNRARLLLQGAGFLDLDKVIEYREPEDALGFWKRPAVPQLSAQGVDQTNMPNFVPQLCSLCSSIIRGSFFHSVESRDKEMVCEGCYRAKLYRHPDFLKSYKHCILADVITPAVSRNICVCSTVHSIDCDGRSKALFPISPSDKHRNGVGNSGALRCGLFDLKEMVAEAKYGAILARMEAREKLSEFRRADEVQRIQAARKKSEARTKYMLAHGKQLTHSSLVNPSTTLAEFGRSSGVEESYADIPFYLRPITNRYPFGNVHMALRLGPLLIENGVSQ